MNGAHEISNIQRYDVGRTCVTCSNWTIKKKTKQNEQNETAHKMKCALLLLDSHYTDRMVVANIPYEYEYVSELNHKLFYITFRSRHNSRQRTHSLPIFARQIASRARHVFAQQTRSFMSFYMFLQAIRRPLHRALAVAGQVKSILLILFAIFQANRR